LATLRVFKHYVKISFLLLGAIDFLVSYLSVYAGAYLRSSGFIGEAFSLDSSLVVQALVFALVLIVSLMALGLYTARVREGVLGYLLRVSASYLFSIIALALLFYIFPNLFLGRATLILSIVISFSAISLIRLVVWFADPEIFKRRILVLGAGQNAKPITELKRKSDQISFSILGFIHIRGEEDIVDKSKIIMLDSSLKDYAVNNDVDEIVLAVEDRRKGFPMHDLIDCKMSGIDVLDMTSFFERETGKIRLDQLNPSWFVFSDGFQQSGLRDYTKRLFDIFVSVILLIVSWPIMLLAVLAISVESRFKEPILYRQIRIGENGKPFQVLKFRSMSVDAERDGKARWAEKNDARITVVGGVIRKTRIDELPQILNVLRGDMSFVGPRPERPEFVVILSEKIPYYEERHRVKPGVTGWAQMCYPYGSSEKDAKEKLQYDLYYVKNHSLFLDFLIIVQTAEIVLFGRGSR